MQRHPGELQLGLSYAPSSDDDMDQEDTNAPARSTPLAQPTTEVTSAATALNQLADVSAEQAAEEEKNEEDARRDQIESDEQYARQLARQQSNTASPSGISEFAKRVREEVQSQTTPVDQRLETLRSTPRRQERVQGYRPPNNEDGEVVPPPNKRHKNNSSFSDDDSTNSGQTASIVSSRKRKRPPEHGRPQSPADQPDERPRCTDHELIMRNIVGFTGPCQMELAQSSRSQAEKEAFRQAEGRRLAMLSLYSGASGSRQQRQQRQRHVKIRRGDPVAYDQTSILHTASNTKEKGFRWDVDGVKRKRPPRSAVEIADMRPTVQTYYQLKRMLLPSNKIPNQALGDAAFLSEICNADVKNREASVRVHVKITTPDGRTFDRDVTAPATVRMNTKTDLHRPEDDLLTSAL